jgi:excisionase family DNA binding protein
VTQQATIAEASRRLGVSSDTIRRRIRHGELPAAKRRTSKGLIWLVDLPDEVLKPEADTAREIERLHDEVGHWRELAMSLRQELAARTQEVRQLLELLKRSQDQLFGLSAPQPGRVREANGRPDTAPHGGRSSQIPPA